MKSFPAVYVIKAESASDPVVLTRLKAKLLIPKSSTSDLSKCANLAGINFEQVNKFKNSLDRETFIRPRNVHLTLSMIGQKKLSKVYPTSTNPIRAPNLMH